MGCFKDELKSLFKKDKSYKTNVTYGDEAIIRSYGHEIDVDRIIAYNLSKGFIIKQSIIFFKTGVKIDDNFYTLMGCEDIIVRGRDEYDFIYDGEAVRFKLPRDIADYLGKMLEILKKYEEKGNACIKQNNIEKAFYYYDQIVGLDYCFTKKILSSTAYYHHKCGNYYLAYAYCMESIKRKHNLAYSYSLLGHMYRFGQGVDKDLDQALYYFDESLKIDPQNHFACNAKANLYYFDLNQKDKVLEIAHQSRDPLEISYIMGACYAYGQGCEMDLDKSNELLLKSLKYNNFGYKLLALNAICVKDEELALKYTKEYEKYYKDYDYLYGLLYAYGIGVKKDAMEAYNRFTKYHEDYPNDFNAYYQLANLSFNSIDLEMAYQYATQCHKEGSSCCNYYLGQKYYCKYGKENQYIKVLEEGIKDHDVECMAGLGDLCFSLRRVGYRSKEGYELLQRASALERQGNFAITTYINHVMECDGIDTFDELRTHFNYIHKIYEKRGKWFEYEYLKLKENYIDRMISITESIKTKDYNELKANEIVKAFYLYSSSTCHVFFLNDYHHIVEIPKKDVDLLSGNIYYSIIYDRNKKIDYVRLRTSNDEC